MIIYSISTDDLFEFEVGDRVKAGKYKGRIVARRIESHYCEGEEDEVKGKGSLEIQPFYDIKPDNKRAGLVRGYTDSQLTKIDD